MSKNINPNLKVVTELTAYESDPNQGWIRMEETSYVDKEISPLRTIAVAEKRSCLYSGSMEALQAKLAEWKRQGGITGRIRVVEMVESEAKQFVKDITTREPKKAGDTGVICCVSGEAIYRFSAYDATGEKTDTMVMHDNGDAIRAINAQRRLETADLDA